MKKNGFVLGKFMPPHLGHLAMLRFAKMHCEHLTVLVESHPDEPMSAEIRAGWIKQALYNDPSISVIPLLGAHPQQPPEVNPEGFWKHWARIIKTHCPNIDVLISSEDYGRKLAQDQGVEWIPFDRNILPMSGTIIREHTLKNWFDLIEPSRGSLSKRVLILGPESTGKSIIGQNLAQTFETVCVPEYAADWIKRQGTFNFEFNEDLLLRFFEGQMASVQALAPQANRVLIEDSHPITTSVWAEYLGFHELSKQIDEWCKNQSAPDHIFLTHPGQTPWVDDIHRGEETNREWFFQAFEEKLKALGWDYEILKGDWDARNHQAKQSVENLMEAWTNQPMREWKTRLPVSIELPILKHLKKLKI